MQLGWPKDGPLAICVCRRLTYSSEFFIGHYPFSAGAVELASDLEDLIIERTDLHCSTLF
jgi:hypothetical protein